MDPDENGPRTDGRAARDPAVRTARRRMATVEIAGRRAVERDCPLCGADAASAALSRYGEAPWPLRRCTGCGFVFIDRAPVYEELAGDHAWERTVVQGNLQRRRRHPLVVGLSKCTRWRLHLFPRKSMEGLLARFASRGNVLDVGCGKGSQLARLPPGFVPHGIEISRAEAAHAERVIGGRGGSVVVKPAIEGLRCFPDHFAVGVFMRSYLEHESDPMGVLEETHRVLAPGGVTIIKVPNYGSLNRRLLGRLWPGFRFPDHLNYFTPATLRAMCQGAGLVVRRFGLRDRPPLGDNMWLVAGSAALTRAAPATRPRG